MWRAPCGRWTRWNITAGGRREAVPQGKATRWGILDSDFSTTTGCVFPRPRVEIYKLSALRTCISHLFWLSPIFNNLDISSSFGSCRPVSVLSIICCKMVMMELKWTVLVHFDLWRHAPPCNLPPPTNLLTLYIRFCIVTHLHTNTWTMNETQTFTIGDMIYCISIYI